MTHLLDLLGIHHTIGGFKNAKEFMSPQTGKMYKPKSGKMYTIRIHRYCTIRFSKLVGFRMRRKQERLHMLIIVSKFKKDC